MDTLRVFAIRLIQKKSPFSADKNHTHQPVARIGMNHRGATYTILFCQSVIYCGCFFIFQWLWYLRIEWPLNLVVCGILMLIPPSSPPSKDRFPKMTPIKNHFL